MVFVPLSPEQIATLRQSLPELSLSTIPAGSYPSMTEDYHTVGLFNFAIAHKDLPDDLVYRMVKSVYEIIYELVKAHPAAKETLSLPTWTAICSLAVPSRRRPLLSRNRRCHSGCADRDEMKATPASTGSHAGRSIAARWHSDKDRYGLSATHSTISIFSLPLSSTRPSERPCAWFRRWSQARPLTLTVPGRPTPAIRAAVFTVSPQTFELELRLSHDPRRDRPMVDAYAHA